MDPTSINYLPRPVDVSVLVPILNESRHLREAMAAMRSQRFAGEIEFLLVDGGSTDGTPAIAAELAGHDPRIRLLANPDRYTPQALNIGLRAARGTYVARMDAHAVYPPDYLQVGVERLRRGDVDWVSGPQVAVGTGRWSRAVALALSTPLGVGSARFRTTGAAEIELDSNGFCGVWRRSTLEAHDGWAEGWPINQDAELAARMHEAGELIVCLPEMAATYLPRESPRSLARQYWRYGQYRAKTSLRHPRSLRRSHLIPPSLVLAVVAAGGPGPARRPARAALAAYGAALVATGSRSRRGSGPGEAPLLPAVLATMHLTWGLGFLVGLVRFAGRGGGAASGRSPTP
jgi:glycosyltransferase involved in cell wall biosynthesis